MASSEAHSAIARREDFFPSSSDDPGRSQSFKEGFLEGNVERGISTPQDEGQFGC